MNRIYDEIRINQFLNITTPEVAYFLGFLWADGCIYTKKKYTYLVQISIVSSDFKYLKKMFKRIGHTNFNKYKPLPKKWQEKTIASIYSKPLTEFLLKNGYDNKENPHIILDIIPENLRSYFYRGLFDGDGHIHVGRKGFSCGLTSSINQDWGAIEKLFKNLNIKYFIQRREKKDGHSSELRISNARDTLLFLDLIYGNFSKDKIGFSRKYSNYKKLKERFQKFVDSKSSVHTGISYYKERKKWAVLKFINKVKYYKYGFVSEADALKYLNSITTKS